MPYSPSILGTMEANFTSHPLARMPRWQHRHLSLNKPQPNTPTPAAKTSRTYQSSPLSTFPARLARLRAINDALGYNATRRTQHNLFPSPAAPFQTPELLVAPFKFNTDSKVNHQAKLSTPSQATGITPFVNARTGGCHESFTTMQQHASAHHDQRTQQREFGVLPPDLGEQQQRHWQLSRSATAMPDQSLAPQQNAERSLKKPDFCFDALAASSPQLQKSLALGLKNTSQQFASPARTASSPQPQITNHSLPSPRTTPVRQTHSPQVFSPKPVTLAPYPQGRSAESVRAEIVYLNEVVERKRLEQERLQEFKGRAKRRAELKKDETALYHNYSEFLQHFPPGRGEHVSPYLIGLLANQPMPAEPTSDLGLVIKYAKRHWENFWEMGDLDYVVRKATEELEETMEARKTSGSTATAAQRR